MAAALCLALALMLRDRLVPAGVLSLGCWVALGVVAACVAERPLPADHVWRRISAGTVELSTLLRRHLRSEPAKLPWGSGIDVDLHRNGDTSLPEVGAGDGGAVITQGLLPPMYRDEGAFDRKEFLAQQNIHLLATLRASSLLQKTGTRATAIASRLARVRGELRERLDEMFVGAPQAAAVLRAMLLGDRSFIERTESVDYQKTGVFHVLVVAGLHVGALAFFLFLGRPAIAAAAGRVYGMYTRTTTEG